MSLDPLPMNADWTTGVEAITFQRCRRCDAVQYFRRGFCRRCGSTALETCRASGTGTVYAVTRVVRAATAEARAHGPYTIVLVDAAEGFRLMAHGAENLAIGDAIAARFIAFTGRLVPFFEKIKS